MLPTHFPRDEVQTIKRQGENEMCQSSYAATPLYAGGPLACTGFYETQNSFLGLTLKSIASGKISPDAGDEGFYIFILSLKMILGSLV